MKFKLLSMLALSLFVVAGAAVAGKGEGVFEAFETLVNKITEVA